MSSSAETARVSTEEVQLRRSPKYGTFMALGAGLGVVIAVIASVSQPALGDYSIGQIIGLTALILGSAGVGLGAVVALVLDRVFARHSQLVEAQRTTVTPVEDQTDVSA